VSFERDVQVGARNAMMPAGSDWLHEISGGFGF